MHEVKIIRINKDVLKLDFTGILVWEYKQEIFPASHVVSCIFIQSSTINHCGIVEDLHMLKRFISAVLLFEEIPDFSVK